MIEDKVLTDLAFRLTSAAVDRPIWAACLMWIAASLQHSESLQDRLFGRAIEEQLANAANAFVAKEMKDYQNKEIDKTE